MVQIASTAGATTTGGVMSSSPTYESQQHQTYHRRRPWNEKADEIEAVLNEPVVDLWKLRELALSEGGLVSDELRRQAWPKLVGCEEFFPSPQISPTAETTIALSPLSSVTTAAAAEQQQGYRGFSAETATASRPAYLLGGHGGTWQHSHYEAAVAPRPSLRLPTSLSTSNNKIDDTSSRSSRSSRNGMDFVVLARSPLDAGQIDLDVHRCTWHLLTGSQRLQKLQMDHVQSKSVARLIRRKQLRLANLINYTLVKASETAASSSPFRAIGGCQPLRYYQGFHDVACIFLSALAGNTQNTPQQQQHQQRAPSSSANTELLAARLGLDVPAAVLERVSLANLRVFLRQDFQALQTCLRWTVMPLLAASDPTLHEYLDMAGMEPFFCLPWVITWFSHEIRDTALVKRLFDAFIVSHPALPIYMSVAMLLHPVNKQDLLSTPCEFDLLHQKLVHLPKQSSMVGWKYRPEDGYISDDDDEQDEDDEEEEEEEDEQEVLENLSRSKSRKDENVWLSWGGGAEEVGAAGNGATHMGSAGGDTASVVSSSMGSTTQEPPRVPFEEVLQGALELLRRFPPHTLLDLARRYHGEEAVQAQLHLILDGENNLLFTSRDYEESDDPTRIIMKRSNLTLLDSRPPPFCLAKKAKPDWLLQEEQAAKTLSSWAHGQRQNQPPEQPFELRQRRRHGKSGEDEQKTGEMSSSVAEKQPIVEDEHDEDELLERRYQRAWIAVGLGRGEAAERKHARQRRKQRRRRLLWYGAATALVVSLALVTIRRRSAALVKKTVGPVDDDVVVVSTLSTEKEELVSSLPLESPTVFPAVNTDASSPSSHVWLPSSSPVPNAMDTHSNEQQQQNSMVLKQEEHATKGKEVEQENQAELKEKEVEQEEKEETQNCESTTSSELIATRNEQEMYDRSEEQATTRDRSTADLVAAMMPSDITNSDITKDQHKATVVDSSVASSSLLWESRNAETPQEPSSNAESEPHFRQKVHVDQREMLTEPFLGNKECHQVSSSTNLAQMPAAEIRPSVMLHPESLLLGWSLAHLLEQTQQEAVGSRAKPAIMNPGTPMWGIDPRSLKHIASKLGQTLQPSFRSLSRTSHRIMEEARKAILEELEEQPPSDLHGYVGKERLESLSPTAKEFLDKTRSPFSMFHLRPVTEDSSIRPSRGLASVAISIRKSVIRRSTTVRDVVSTVVHRRFRAMSEESKKLWEKARTTLFLRDQELERLRAQHKQVSVLSRNRWASLTAALHDGMVRGTTVLGKKLQSSMRAVRKTTSHILDNTRQSFELGSHPKGHAGERERSFAVHPADDSDLSFAKRMDSLKEKAVNRAIHFGDYLNGIAGAHLRSLSIFSNLVIFEIQEAILADHLEEASENGSITRQGVTRSKLLQDLNGVLTHAKESDLALTVGSSIRASSPSDHYERVQR